MNYLPGLFDEVIIALLMYKLNQTTRTWTQSDARLGAVRQRAMGQCVRPFDRDLDSRAPHEGLSARELQVFLMLASGKTVSKIADVLNLSIKTVSTHKCRFMLKMNIQTKTDLVRYAIRHQLIDG